MSYFLQVLFVTIWWKTFMQYSVYTKVILYFFLTSGVLNLFYAYDYMQEIENGTLVDNI